MTFNWLSPQLIYPVEVQGSCGFAIIMIFTLLLTTKRMLNKLLIVNVWFQDSIVDILTIQYSIILIQTTEYNDNAKTHHMRL